MAIAFFRFPSLSSTKRITIIQGQSRNLDLRGVFLKKRPALLLISTRPEESQKDIEHLQKYVTDIRKHKWPETRMLYGGIKYGMSIAFEKVKARRVESVKDIVELARRLGHPSGEEVGKWVEDGLAICPGIGPWAKTGGRISFQGATPREKLLRAQGSNAVKLFPNHQPNYQVPEHIPKIRKVEPQPGIQILPGGKVRFKGLFPPPPPGDTRDPYMNPGPKDDVIVAPKPAAGTAPLRKVESGDIAELADKKRQELEEIDELFRERDEARFEREQREIKEVMQMIGTEEKLNRNQNYTIRSHDHSSVQEITSKTRSDDRTIQPVPAISRPNAPAISRPNAPAISRPNAPATSTDIVTPPPITWQACGPAPTPEPTSTYRPTVSGQPSGPPPPSTPPHSSLPIRHTTTSSPPSQFTKNLATYEFDPDFVPSANAVNGGWGRLPEIELPGKDKRSKKGGRGGRGSRWG